MGPVTLRGSIGISALLVTVGTATGFGIVGCSDRHTIPTAPTAVTVAQWMHNGGSRIIQTLGDDFTALDGPNRAFDLPKMAAGCRHLLTDIHSAQAYAPVPDVAIESDWKTALASYAAGATDCDRGSKSHDYSLIITSASEFAQGTKMVAALTPRLDELAQN
jgi:hypothetical protein